jgi:hypothetical protein
MSKSKKARTPQIDPRVLTRPRLDALFASHGRAELDDDGLFAGVQSLMVELGEHQVLDSLVKRMEGTPETERGVLMMIVERLKSPEVIAYLWQQVKKPRALSTDAKLTALVVLNTMGEEVDLADPSRYFSPHELKPSDFQSAETMFRMGWRGFARTLRSSRDSVEVEALMREVSRMSEKASDETDLFQEIVADAEHNASDLEADFLLVLAYTSPFPKIQQAAERALARLAERNVMPITPAILDLKRERFHAAFMSDPDNPWQRSVTVAWERAGGDIQAFVFLLDYGMPWGGAIKDVFITKRMTAAEFQRELIDKQRSNFVGEGMGLYRIRLSRAKATIAAAVEANRKHNIKMSKDYTEFRHLIDRWVLNPSAISMELDTTQDELDRRRA